MEGNKSQDKVPGDDDFATGPPPQIMKAPTAPSQSGPKHEHLFKVLVIGELGTGKTSFIKRYVHNFFSPHYRATIGVDFALKVISWDENTVIRVQLWDIAGQERFGNMTRVYYKDAVGAFLLFDVTRVESFQAVEKWKTDLDYKVQLPDGRPIPCVLIGNKSDQPISGPANNDSHMETFCKEKGFAGWYLASAKENINVEEASKFLVEKVLDNEKLKTAANGHHMSSNHHRHLGESHFDGGPRILMLDEDSMNNNAKRKNCSC